MMKQSVTVLLFFMLALMACRNHSSNTKTTAVVADTAKFFPLTAFFKDQLAYAKALHKPAYCITIKDGKKDSFALNETQFRQWVNIFLQRNIDSPAMKALYRETVFQDLATKSYTLSYSPADGHVPIRSIDILLDEQSSQVKRIFIRSLFNKGDTSINEQCNWKAFKSFQVNRSLRTGNYSSTELNYVNWNNDTP
jgi:hypothetical protein